jgi:hypothetical protein
MRDDAVQKWQSENYRLPFFYKKICKRINWNNKVALSGFCQKSEKKIGQSEMWMVYKIRCRVCEGLHQ